MKATTRWMGWAAAGALALWLAGCGGGGGDGDPPPAIGSGVATIGAGGGAVSGEGGAEVRFPAKALAANITVRIAKDGTGAPPLPSIALPAGAVYMITPHGGALDRHAEVSIPVERTEIGPDEQLLLVTAQPGDAQWTVLSGATYSNGALRAPVMHFSFFQAIVLTNLSMPSLVTTIGHDTDFWVDVFARFNNVGGPGIGRFGADFEFNQESSMQSGPALLQARLTYPAPPTAVRVGVSPPSPRVCLPTSYGHNGAVWRFLRNGNEALSPLVNHVSIVKVAESIYPRFESEIYYDGSARLFGSGYTPGFGALHLYGQDAPRRGAYAPAGSADVWALPPPGNRADNDALTWRGTLVFNAEQHNGRMRIDVTIATDCNLLLEAVPIAFSLNLASRAPSFNPYNGVMGAASPISVASGDTAVLPFEEEFDGSTLSIAWEYSSDVANWQKLPVPAQYIRDDGRSGFAGRYFEGHRYAIVIPNVQPGQAGWYRAWSCSKPQPKDGGFPAVPSVCLSRNPVQLVVLTEPPTILTQPSAQIVQVGETTSFMVRGSGGPDVDLAVQWQKRALVEAAFGVGSWTPIAGATDYYYTTPPAVATDTGTLYRAVLTSALGSTPTDAALLTVIEQLAPPIVQSQPGNSNTVVGGTAVFVATVSGTAPLSYQWRREGVNITGANSPVLTLSNVSAASDARYDLVVTNRAGSATTEPARLVVTLATPVALPPTIAAAPASITVAAGQAANFAVAVNGTGPYTYTWQKNGSAAPIPGAEAASFSIPSATAADAGTYSVRVTNTVGTALSAAATLTVTPATGTPVAPTITTGPVGVAALPGAAATFAVAVSGTAPFSYQWRRNGSNIPGATGPVLHIATVGALDAGQYALEVGNAAGVTSSAAVPLIVIGAPAITNPPAAAAAGAGANVTFSVTATGDALRYQWTRNQVGIAGATAASYTTPALTTTDNGAVYGVIVYNGAGLVISPGAVLSVAAAPAQWQTAAAIETDDTGNAQTPSIAVNAAGEAVAIWMQPGGGGISDNIWANRYTPAGGWGTAQVISDVQGGAQGAQAVAIDASGNATAVWQQSDSIWTNRYTAGSGWGTPVLIETSSGWAGNPQIGMDANGNALAVWWQREGSRINIEAARYVAGAGWGAPEIIENDDSGDTGAPQIAVDAAGNAVVVWPWAADLGGFNFVYNVWANRYAPGTGWGSATPIDINNTTQPNPAPQVALGADGNAIAVWHRPDGSFDSVASNRYTAGIGWGSAALLETDPAVVSRNARVAVDPAGNAIAVWEQYVGATANVMASRYTAGGGWGAAALIETDDAGSAFTPQIVIDANGNGTALWSQRNAAGFTFSIWTNRYVPGSGWGSAAAIDGQAQPARQPALGVDASGRLVAVWEQTVGALSHLWASVFR